MATVYRSKTTGEYGVLGDDNNFAWVSRDEAKEALKADSWYCAEGEPLGDSDPLWDGLDHIHIDPPPSAHEEEVIGESCAHILREEKGGALVCVRCHKRY